MPYHIDGESMPPTDSFEVTVKPGSLKMIVPDSPGKHL
jgi:diacylglycerol kinase family enzyme